jgi:hypothetical protein
VEGDKEEKSLTAKALKAAKENLSNSETQDREGNAKSGIQEEPLIFLSRSAFRLSPCIQ